MKEASTAAAAFAVLGTSRAWAGANDKLGVGFIGCGGRGNSHMQTVHWLKENGGEALEIVAMCDAYRPRMAKAADGFGGKQ
jgi:predicted dehydrogenase